MAFLKKAEIEKVKRSKRSKIHQLIRLGELVLKRSRWTQEALCSRSTPILSASELVEPDNEKDAKETLKVIQSANAKCFCATGAIIRAGLEAKFDVLSIIRSNTLMFDRVERENDQPWTTKTGILNYLSGQP